MSFDATGLWLIVRLPQLISCEIKRSYLCNHTCSVGPVVREL